MRLSLRSDRIEDDHHNLWALVSHKNPLIDGFCPTSAHRVVSWTGWFGETADPSTGLFPRDFRTWTPGAWQRLQHHLTTTSAELLLRPHARHIVSDAQACVLLVRDLPSNIRLLLDPISMLEPAMLNDAQDHIARILDLAESAAGIIIAGAELVADSVRPSRDGPALPRDTVESWIDRLAPSLPRVYFEHTYTSAPREHP
jgi:hypothetical protein